MSRIDEIKAREAAATKGPWKWPCGGGMTCPRGDHDELFVEFLNCSWEDGQFIAHAREDIPDMIPVVEQAVQLCELGPRDVGYAEVLQRLYAAARAFNRSRDDDA